MPNYTIQLRRGTAAEHSSFTGAAGEVTVNTTRNSVHIHDGSTAGGTEMATKSSVDNLSSDTLIDADNNTHVKVEATTDVNEVQMTAAGNLVAKVTSTAILPGTNDTYNLGASGNEWNDVFVDNVIASTSITDGALTIQSGSITNGVAGTFSGQVQAGTLVGALTGASTGAHNGTVGATTPSTVVGTTITAGTNFVGDLTGDVTGDLTGAHNGTVGATTPSTVVGTTITAGTNFVGDLTGDVTGDLTGDVTGSIAGVTANMSGTVTGATITDGTMSINGGSFTSVVDFTSTGNMVVGGNFTVNGTTTTVNTETLTIDDNIIVLNNNEAGTPSQNAGIEVERGTSANKTFIWDEGNDRWTVGSETIVAGTFEGDLTGAVTGNASTATKWATGRTITLTGDVTGVSGSFDGSGNLSFATTIAANSVALGTDTTGNYVQQGATSGNGISGSVNSEGGTFTVTSNATSANTASTIVFRDGSGNFSAGTITATATAAQYADLAERYHSGVSIDAGSVVCFGGQHEIEMCNEDASTRVAGVISTAPAFMMNKDAGNDDTHPYVALSGRVPCKVQGPIVKGDLLVSSTNGHAKAGAFVGGAVIGKALENFDGESGVIEVLVNLM